MPVRLVALDLDGTVFGDDLTPTPRTRAALAAVQARGIPIVLATGRTLRSTRGIAAALGVTAPLICYQGAWVQDQATGATLLHRTVPRAIAIETILRARTADQQCNVYIADQTYVERVKPEAAIYLQLNRASLPEQVPDLAALVAQAPQEPTKVVLVLPDAATTTAVAADLVAHFGAAIYATQSHPLFAEVINPHADKGTALALVAAHLGVAQADTLAVGDGMNDIPLLRWAGLGVAMGHAAPAVHAAADHVTGPLVADGLAQALERLVL